MKRIFLMGICIFLFQSCSGVSVIPTVLGKDGKAISYPPVPESEVKIYRTTKVEGSEIGVITFHGEGPRVDIIFNVIRKEAAKIGAHFVTDFKLKVVEETYIESTQSCSGGSMGQGQTCTTSTSQKTRQNFTASGTLKRKNG